MKKLGPLVGLVPVAERVDVKKNFLENRIAKMAKRKALEQVMA